MAGGYERVVVILLGFEYEWLIEGLRAYPLTPGLALNLRSRHSKTLLVA